MEALLGEFVRLFVRTSRSGLGLFGVLEKAALLLLLLLLLLLEAVEGSCDERAREDRRGLMVRIGPSFQQAEQERNRRYSTMPQTT